MSTELGRNPARRKRADAWAKRGFTCALWHCAGVLQELLPAASGVSEECEGATDRSIG
jgi:hypothetical protein